MSKPTNPRPQKRIQPGFIITLLIAAAGIAAWMAASSSALGLIEPTAAPTHARSFAVAEIAKPAYAALPTATSLPTSLPTATEPSLPTQSPTYTPEAVIQAEIVVDAPASEYAAPVLREGYEQAAVSYGGNKYILVDISEQHMYVYEGDALVFSFVSSTGMNNATRVGSFSVLDKIPNAYGATWNIWMPNWLGIYWAGSLENGIHALPILPNGGQLWAGYLGAPISYGCVVLGQYESQLLYDWAEIGTPVEIRW